MAPRHSAFPLATATIALTLTAAGLYAVAGWAMPALFGHQAKALEGVSLMAAVVWFSLVLSVLPVAMVGRLGVMPTVYAYFFGAGMRFVLCLVAGGLLVKVGQYPANPVMVTLPTMYVPLLFVEAGIVGRYLWKMTARPAAAKPSSGAAQDGKEALA